jgi:hypothetical protein
LAKSSSLGEPSGTTLGGAKPKPRSKGGLRVEKQYVGIDLHRRRSVIVRMTEDGEVLECVRIVNDPVALSLELAKAGPDPEVALESTYGWVRHEAPFDRVGCETPPAVCRSRPLKLEAA